MRYTLVANQFWRETSAFLLPPQHIDFRFLLLPPLLVSSPSLSLLSSEPVRDDAPPGCFVHGVKCKLTAGKG
jgi:hypothetical protein